MRKISLLLASLALIAVSGPLFAGKIQYSGTAPTISTGNAAIDSVLNAQLQATFDQLLVQATDQLDNINDMPDFMKSMSTANAFTSHAATQRNFQNYDIFAISIGTMGSAVVPGLSTDKLGNVADDLTDEGDAEVGAAWQTWAAQIGINAGFLLDGLYLGAKIGMLNDQKLPGTDKFKFDSMNLGLLANYEIMKERSLLGALVWRGLSFGTGVIYQANKTDFQFNAGSKSLTNTVSGYDYTMEIDPDLLFKMESSSVVIPFEISTAVRILWALNLSVGAGFDLNFGKTEISIGSRADVDLEMTGVSDDMTTPGLVTADASIKSQNAELFTPKLTAGFGLGMGPVMIDIPATLYFGSTTAFSVGLTAGIVF